MKEKVQSALDNYVLAYTNNDKSLFRSLWDDQAIFDDPVGADPCIGIEAICEFWDFGHASGCLLYTSPSPRDATLSRMPSSA